MTMRIAHFSDVHALHLEGVSPLWFFNKRLAGGLNLLLRRKGRHPLPLLAALCEDINEVAPDHVVVTGDLSNLSLPSELQRARAMLDQIRLGPREVTVIPGNHDIYVWEARRARHFERSLGPYALSDGEPEGAMASFPLCRVRGEVAIIGACTALPSPPPLADGWLGRRQLHAIEQLLSAQRGRFRVLLMHHPPVRNRYALLRGLRDRGALQEVILRAGCELILHGHEHRDLRAEIPGRDGPVPVIGVASGTYEDGGGEDRGGHDGDGPAAGRRARYNIYTIEGGRLRSIEQRVHDAASGRFITAVPRTQ
jgi:3',5'-cyclic AMP phosphodiesterase CpdA